MSSHITPWPAGMPCWTDLATPDVAAAQEFYGAVVGWDFQPPDEAFGGYVIAEMHGGAAAGIGPLMDDQQRPSWTLYLASDDAEATAAAVTEHGGTVMVPTMEVGSLGKMVIASDPAGGVFGVWQPDTFIGAEVVNEPGGITWEDLRSTDPDAARTFYGALFDFDYRALEAAGPDYAMFLLKGDQAPLGGMGGMFGAPEGTPSHWLVYFSVANADDAVLAAGAHGGQVLAPPFDTEFGRMAGIVDPAGAVFWVAEVAPGQPMPDRTS